MSEMFPTLSEPRSVVQRESIPKSFDEQIERLEKFRDGLRLVHPTNFDMRYWTNGPIPQVLVGFPQHSCGTTACAAGHLPVIFPDNFAYSYHDPVLTTPKVSSGLRIMGDHAGFEAKWFFGTNKILNLFDPHYYEEHVLDVTPCVVAEEIDKLIQELKAEHAAQETLPQP